MRAYTADEWAEKSKWDTNRRISYSYHRALENVWADPDCCGVLICEDDVDFRPGFLPKLQAVLNNLAADGKRFFTLSLYTVGDLDPRFELDMGDLYGIYPEWLFWGGQGVFFSRDTLPLALDFFARHGWRDVDENRDCNDRLVGRFGHSMWRMFGLEGGHYRSYRDLVQHTGEVVSMSSFFHFSDTFARPWPGEETETWKQEPTDFGPELEKKKNASHLALPGQQWVWLNIPLTGTEHLTRSLAHAIGLPVGGAAFVKSAELPCFADSESVPVGWKTAVMLQDPLARVVEGWRYLRSARDSKLPPDLRGNAAFKLEMTLAEFVTVLANTSDAARPECFRSQSWFLQGVEPDFIGRMSDAGAEFAQACEAMGLGRIRTFLARPYAAVESGLFDDATRELVRQAYAKDFARWEA